MAMNKPAVTTTTKAATTASLVTLGVGAVLVALVSFLPAAEPVVTAVSVTYLENHGYTIIAPVEPVSATSVE